MDTAFRESHGESARETERMMGNSLLVGFVAPGEVRGLKKKAFFHSLQWREK